MDQGWEKRMDKTRYSETFSEILPTSHAFKRYWKNKGPFKYALTSAEYPPILLEPEEWLFSNDIVSLLKQLMKWNERQMKIVEAPFNPRKQNVLKPETLSPWKILNFPEEWETAVCDAFTPVGHLTRHVEEMGKTSTDFDFDGEDAGAHENSGAYQDAGAHQGTKKEAAAPTKMTAADMEAAFFRSLKEAVEKIGYVLLKPEPHMGEKDIAYIKTYLDEWQADEDEG